MSGPCSRCLHAGRRRRRREELFLCLAFLVEGNLTSSCNRCPLLGFGNVQIVEGQSQLLHRLHLAEAFSFGRLFLRRGTLSIR